MSSIFMGANGISERLFEIELNAYSGSIYRIPDFGKKPAGTYRLDVFYEKSPLSGRGAVNAKPALCYTQKERGSAALPQCLYQKRG